MTSTGAGSWIDRSIAQLDAYFGTGCSVQLPDGVRELLVRFGPWITLVVLVISLPAILATLGISTLLSPFLGPRVTGFGVTWLLNVVQTGLVLVALPGLFRRRYASWRLLFLGQVVGIAGNLLSGPVLGTALGAVLGLFLLFQIRPKYLH